MLNRKFPLTRLRRLRSNSFIRDIVDENKITTDDLIQPIFVKDSDGIEEIDKMPNVFRYGLDVLVKEVREICELGIKSIAIFPVIDSSKRDAAGSEAFNENNLACSAIKLIKEHYPDLIIISDVALDPYTNHGHDGVLIDGYVDNDLTVSALVKQALCLANAGADIIAPSDMMDGRIKFIREALEESNFKNTIILSYAAKYSSSFYGPFREAVKSSSKLGNSSKSYYQMS
jgi:porphobilinogen synthase